MSKVITTRFEYACYDDADGNLNPGNNLPPTYPLPLDIYSSSSSASTSQSYAAFALSGSGPAVSVATPAGATVTFVSPSSNANWVLISQPAVALTPGAAPGSLLWPVGPGQIVTLPGALNAGALSVQTCNAALSPTTLPFALNLAWSL